MKGLRIICASVLGLLATACGVTRHIPEGHYLVQKVQFEDDKSVPREERITASEFAKYIRQSPNKRLLGINFYVWLYQHSNPKKQNWWNNTKRKIGEEPVLLDMSLTERSVQNLKFYMDSRGFYSSTASFEVDTTSHPKRATITYRTHQGRPSRIDSIGYDFQDKFLRQIILPDTVHSLLREGEIFDISTLDHERERITSYLKQRGYYNFSVNNIEYVADTLRGDDRVGLTMVIKQNTTGYNERGKALMDNNTVYRIDQINIYPDYQPVVTKSDSTFANRLDTLSYRGLNVIYEKKPNVRGPVLRGAVPLYPNYVYNSEQVNQTYTDLMALGYFKSVKIAFVEQPRQVDVSNMVTYVGSEGDSTQTHYTQEGYLQCNILCTPALKQNYKIDLEASTTSSFYGLKTRLGYQNRNIFRGAEALDIGFTAGLEFMTSHDVQKKTAKEIGVSVGLSYPRFLVPWRVRWQSAVNQPRTKLEVSVNFQDRPFYRRTLSSAALTYSWSNKNYSSFSLRPVDINVVDVSSVDTAFLNNTRNRYLQESFVTQFIGGMSFGYVYSNQLKHLGGNATIIRFNAETAGNLIGAFAHMLGSTKADDDFYTIFGIRYAQYARADINASRKIMLGEKTALVGRIYGGAALAYGNTSVVPFDRLFYAGGSNGMRGWAARTLGPGSVPEAGDGEYPTQLGDMKLEANLEFRFPIWGMINGATFLDAGNIWYIRQSDKYSPEAVFHFDKFYKQLGFNTGLGIRLDIKFAVLRLDWGVQLHNPNRPEGERWIHNFKWQNMALNFGVGYPF